MKCYVHQNADAVGVCTVCGRGVCRRCAVRLGGKLYCKEDADRVLGANRAVVEAEKGARRGVGVMLGAIFAYLLGGVAGIIGCLVIFAAIVSGGTSGGAPFGSLFDPDMSFLGSIQQDPSTTIAVIGAAALVFGLFGIAAGFYTWRPSKVGVVMSIAFGFTGLVGGFELSSISASPVLVDSWFALSGLTIAMSVIGLVQLTRQPARTVASLRSPGPYPRPNN